MCFVGNKSLGAHSGGLPLREMMAMHDVQPFQCAFGWLAGWLGFWVSFHDCFYPVVVHGGRRRMIYQLAWVVLGE